MFRTNKISQPIPLFFSTPSSLAIVDSEPLIRGARGDGQSSEQRSEQEEVAAHTPRRVQTRANQQMLLYPNPSTDRIHLEFMPPNGVTAAASAAIRILTIDGAEVLATSTACTTSGGHTTLDVQHIARGMYLVEIVVNGKRMISRFVKQ